MWELIAGGLLIEATKAWKADDIERAALEKNSRAFGKQAEAQEKVKLYKERLFEKMQINAVRKNAILQFHINKFLDVYKMIDEYSLNKGLGIIEMEKIEALKMQMVKHVDLPAVANGIIKSDQQLVTELAIYGIGGVILKDAKEKAKLASRNMANANVALAQADTICIFYDSLGEKVQACTDILQKLAAKDIQAINHIDTMLRTKGQDESLYTNEDVDAINLCSELNILIYEIINTPLIDENNEPTQVAMKIIQKGEEFLHQLG